MATQCPGPVDYTPAPQPTIEELATIMELHAENMQLLELRKLHMRTFEALYIQLVQTFEEDCHLRKENQRLREELVSIASTQGFDTTTYENWKCASSEEGVTSIQEFFRYLFSITEGQGGPDYQDLPPHFPSLTSFLDAQTDRGSEIPQGENTSEAMCRASAMQTSVWAATRENTHRPWDVRTAAVPGQGITMRTYATSATEGYTLPANPTLMINQCQNFISMEPENITVPIQRLEAFNYTAPRSNRLVEDHLPQVSTTSAPISQCANLHDAIAEHLHVPTAVGWNASPYQNHAEACQPPQPSGRPQGPSDNLVNNSSEDFTAGSEVPTENLHCESACEEGLRLVEHNQARGSTTQSSSVSSTGPLSSSIAPGATTLVIRNIPARYTKELLMQEWPPDGTYDFLFLPFSFKLRRTAGYAFINFQSHGAAVAFHKQWHGKSLRDQGTARKLSVSAAGVQGLEENVRHVFALNGNRVQKTKFLPSVFNGVHEVPYAEVLEKMNLSDIDGPAEQDV